MARAAGPLIHLGTRCGSVDEFVERFAPFATETSLVMPTSSEVKAGTEGSFVIHLKDRSPVMSGRCRVEEVKPVASGGGRMVMRVRLLGMDEPSRNVHKQLLASKRPAPPPPVAAAPKPPPLHIVRAPTLIGAAPKPIGAALPPIGTAQTLIGTLPPPLPVAPPPPVESDVLEKTMESIRPVETQAPSAVFTLPANPLSELEAGDLASFIECTLFEADGEVDAAPERPASDDAKTPHALLDDEARPAPAPPPAPSAEAAGDGDAAPPQTVLRRRLMHAAPYALCTVIGVIVGAMLRSSPSTPPPPSPRATQAAPVVAAPAVVAPPPAAPAVAPPAPTLEPSAAEPAPAPAPPTASARTGCTASIASEPPDAVVEWAGRPLGHTPLRDVAVPCGAATLTLRHERYKDITRAVTAEPTRALALSERLHRPMGTLFLSASPPRATFTVNQLPLEPGTRKLSTWRYETIHVQATMPGYAPWRRTFYFKDETAKVNAQLVALAKPAVRPPFRR